MWDDPLPSPISDSSESIPQVLCLLPSPLPDSCLRGAWGRSDPSTQELPSPMAPQGRAGQGSSRPLGPAVSTATRGQRAGAGGRGPREEAEEKGRAGQHGTGRKKGEGGGAGCRGGGLVDMRGASPRRPGGQRRASAGGGAAHTSPPCAGLQMCGGEREAGGQPPSSPAFCLPPALPSSSPVPRPC